MIKNPYPGRFIAFEGMDGCGKSTQAKKTHDFLVEHGEPVLLTKEPNKNFPSGKLIYRFLFGRDSIKFSDMSQIERQRYYFMNRIEHYAQVVIPALKQGTNVISDRSLVSIALDVQKPGDLDWLLADEVSLFAMSEVEFIRPDAALIFDLPPELAVARLGQKDERQRDFFEQPEKMQRTRNSYLEFANTFPDFCHVIEGSRSTDQVFVDARRVIAQTLRMTEWR